MDLISSDVPKTSSFLSNKTSFQDEKDDNEVVVLEDDDEAENLNIAESSSRTQRTAPRQSVNNW